MEDQERTKTNPTPAQVEAKMQEARKGYLDLCSSWGGFETAGHAEEWADRSLSFQEQIEAHSRWVATLLARYQAEIDRLRRKLDETVWGHHQDEGSLNCGCAHCRSYRCWLNQKSGAALSAGEGGDDGE